MVKLFVRLIPVTLFVAFRMLINLSSGVSKFYSAIGIVWIALILAKTLSEKSTVGSIGPGPDGGMPLQIVHRSDIRSTIKLAA